MKYEKYIHFAAGLFAMALSFTADALSLELSADTVWMLRGFSVAALGLGGFKYFKEQPAKAEE